MAFSKPKFSIFPPSQVYPCLPVIGLAYRYSYKQGCKFDEIVLQEITARVTSGENWRNLEKIGANWRKLEKIRAN